MTKVYRKITFCLMFLTSFVSISTLGILERLEYPQYDHQTILKMRPIQFELDNYLRKKLEKGSRKPVTIELEPCTYNENQTKISLENLQMIIENLNIKSTAELKQQILLIELTATNIDVVGKSFIKSESRSQEINFRFTSSNVTCSGNAGLLMNQQRSSCEWVLLDCTQELFSPLENMFFEKVSERKPFTERNVLAKIIEEGILSNIELVLNSESLFIINAALLQMDLNLGMLLYNAGNSKLAKLQTSDSNDVLDGAILLITTIIKNKYNDTVPIPDIVEGIRCLQLLALVRCDTGFVARNGFANKVSTLQRVGNAKITDRIFRNSTIVDFAGTLKFQNLNIFYNKYRAAVFGIGPEGRLRLSSEPIIVGIRFSINFGSRKITLNSFKLKKLGKTQVAVSGVGILLGSALKKISSWTIAIFNGVISKIVEQRVASYAREALNKSTIDNIIAGDFLSLDKL